MARDESFFASVKLEEIELNGQRVNFPLRYYDYPRISATFPAPADKVRAILPSKKLSPIQPNPGTALVYLTAFEYNEVDRTSPYNEFSISVPVSYEKGDNAPGIMGLYILHLPVTTEEARAAGIELCGFPKFLAEIEFEETPESRRCILQADGKGIVTLEVKKLAVEPQSLEAVCFTVKAKQLFVTPLLFKGEWGTSGSVGGASFVLGDHPIAQELRGLEIGATSVEHTYAPHQYSLLYLPRERLPL